MTTPFDQPTALVLYATFIESSKLRALALENGETIENANAIVANAMRVAWPKKRDEPWRYLCDECNDTGWIYRTCTPIHRCGRPFRYEKQRGDDYTGRRKCESDHEYVVTCFCDKGRSFDNWWLDKKRGDPSDFTSATKTPKKPARFGV